MSFLNLWWAAVAAAVVVPALLLLYFLKLRRREEPVPSTLLWKRAVQDLQVNTPFQRLRKNLLLLLQLLVLAMAILALARAVIQTTVADEDRLVLLIDRSASMNAREGDATRLELAREQAVRLVRTLNRRTRSWRSFLSFGAAEAGTQAMVIAFADRATVVAPFTTNTAELAGLLEGIEPTDGPTDLREALELAEAYMAPPTMLTPGMESTPVSAEVPSKLVLISDGRVSELDQLVLKSGALELLRIGAAQDNVGITALRTERSYEQPEILSVFLAVANFGPAPVTTDVSIYIDGRLAAVKPLELPGRPPPAAAAAGGPGGEPRAAAGSRAALSFDLTLTTAAVIEARLSRSDALAADNTAWAVVPPPQRQRVLVVSERNFFLDSVLRGLPLAEAPRITPAQYEADPGACEADGRSKYDVVIFDKYQPARLPAGSFLFLGCVPKLGGLRAGPPQEPFALIWWEETHPVLRHVSLDPVVVYEAPTLEAPPEAEVLIEGPRGPVLVRYGAEGRQCLVLAFAVEQSNWWAKPGFPVFMYNAIRYLGGGSSAGDQGPLRPGATLRIPVPAGRDAVDVVRPDGRRVTLRADAGGIAHYAGTERVGVYAVEPGVAGWDRFAVNLEDERESDIAPPAGPLRVGTREVPELALIRTATPEVWRWFIGAALVLVLLEWWVYNRRVML